MNKVLFVWFSILFLPVFKSWSQQACLLIPAPAYAEKGKGFFVLTQETPVRTEDPALIPVVRYVQQELLKNMGLSLSTQLKSELPSIKFVLSAKKNVVPGSYRLDLSASGICVTASEISGAFYGAVSILQLTSLAKASKEGNVLLDSWTIEDAPAYSWRGFMLDESRHFFGKQKVKSILDWMAFYKLNRFHWHLTDEPAWRIEIKKYPKLALVGGIGDFLDENNPAKYYTQEDVKEIVAYAAERQILVVPEIDMPGHATAANRAYPDYSGGGSKAHPEFTFNPGNEAVYHYLTNIVKETNVLFPSGWIHLGGDEVIYGNEQWKTDAAVTALKQKEHLVDDKAAEVYFIKRMADSVYKINAKALVWDEMATAGLPVDQTLIFWWRHDHPGQLKLALERGYKTVLCPRLPLYFDFVQDSTHRYGRKWDKLYNALERVYDFDVSKIIPNVSKDNILGVQANLWTETVATEQRMDYLLFPRIAALAEIAWTTPQHKNRGDFMKRMKSHLQLYEKAGIYNYDPFSPLRHPEPVGARKLPVNYKD